MRRIAEHRVLRPTFEPEQRAVGTGAFAGLTVPQYLVEQAAPAARAEAPLVQLLARPLPPEGLEVDTARWTTPATAEAQSGENVAATTVDPASAATAAPVRTYEVRVDASRQAMGRASQAFDAVVLPDLTAAVDVRIDFDLIQGPGTSGRITGLLSTAGITTVTYTDATPTVAELLPLLEQAYRASSAARGAPPNLLIMNSRRWSWFRQGIAVESGIGASALLSAPKIPQAVATYGGDLQVIADNNVPTNLGGGTNEDRVILARDDVLQLWVAPSAVRLVDEQSTAGNLRSTIVPYRYAAFTAASIPASVCVLAGTGLVTPTP